MKSQNYYFLILCYCLISCNSSKNTDAFINQFKGRYLFNANEIIEVHFKNKELALKWRGDSTISPVKLNDSAFFVKELNEKFIFKNKPNTKIVLEKKIEHKGKIYEFKKLKPSEKIPNEYFNAKDYNKAQALFLKIQEKDSLDNTINRYNLNKLANSYSKKKEFVKAKEMYKIISVLYPKISNSFYNLGNAYLKLKDTVNSKLYFNKALKINPENRSVKRALKKLK